MYIVQTIERFGRRRWGALILCATPFFIILLPFLLGIQVFYGHETRFYPYFFFYKNAITTGTSFLWDSFNYSGFPIFVSTTGGFFSPILYVFLKFFPIIQTYAWMIFLNLSFAAFGTFLLCKRFGIGFWAALLSGIVFGFSQWLWIDDLGIANVFPLLPFFFLLLIEIQRRKKWPVFALGVLVAHGFFVGNFHYFLETLFGVFLFALFLLGYRIDSGEFSFSYWRENIRVLGGYFLGVCIGTLFALPQIIPALVYAPLSAERTAIDHWEAVGNGIGINDLPKLISPSFDFWFLPSSTDTFYLGALPLIFFLLSFRARKNPPMYFFLFLFFVSVFLALNNSWLFWLLHHLPPFHLLHFSFRWMFIGWFAAAVLAGFGLDALRIEIGPLVHFYRRVFGWMSAVLISVSAVSSLFFFVWGSRVLAFLQEYFQANLYESTSKLPLEHYYDYIERLFTQVTHIFSPFNAQFLISILSIVLAWYLLRVAGRQTLLMNLWVPFAVGCACINLILVWQPFTRDVDVNIFKREPAFATFIKKHGQVGGRVLTFLKGYTEFEKLDVPSKGQTISYADRFTINNEMLFANSNLLHNISSVEIYEPLMSRRMARIVALLGSDLVWTDEKLSQSDLFPQEKATILKSRRNLLNFLNIQYIVSAYPIDFPKVSETEIIPPFNISLGLYENTQARPLFYFADSLDVVPENEVVAFEKIRTIPETGRYVFVECRMPCPIKTDINGMGSIDVRKKTSVRSVLRTESADEQFLVFSENNLPGWRAYIDGNEIPLYTVGSVYIGLVVPRGIHEVQFEFTYRSVIESFFRNQGFR